mmetsp:Transcript_28241/g.72656  ORF Transcript_28241/g.72656 Transcript_28241/m.72656 type:complete len:87 (+) Transcript_28241:449-709(+)
MTLPPPHLQLPLRVVLLRLREELSVLLQAEMAAGGNTNPLPPQQKAAEQPSVLGCAVSQSLKACDLAAFTGAWGAPGGMMILQVLG